MEARYSCDTKGGKVRLVRGKDRRWRMYAVDEFLGSFATAEAAVDALANGSCKWPAGLNPEDWKQGLRP